MRDDVTHELRLATTESSRAVAREEQLTATVGDRTLSVETRLAAKMALDNIMWKRRIRVQDYIDDAPDRITIAKQNGERTRATRRRAKRIEAGLQTRRPRHPTGAWLSTERPDAATVRDGYRLCATCHGPIADTRANNTKFCSPRCARAARAARRLTAGRGGRHG